jgi:single-strand DNA-binding protein
MKVITLAGNVGKDAETRTTQGGQSVTGFTVAVTDRQKATTWFDVSLWGKRGETVAQYVTKGAKIVVTGELGTREHNGKTYLTVNASDVTLMGGKRDDAGEYRAMQAGGEKYTDQVGYGTTSANRDIDDEIPF